MKYLVILKNNDFYDDVAIPFWDDLNKKNRLTFNPDFIEKDFKNKKITDIRVPCFQIGEIIIVNDDLTEVNRLRRDIKKFKNTSYEVFESFLEALDKSIEISGGYKV
jgi:hypothetical protein